MNASVSLTRRTLVLASVLAGVACFAPGAIEPAQAETRTLRLADTLPAASSLSQNVAAWAKAIEERSDGRLKIEYYPGSQIVGAKDSLDGVLGGVVDIAYTAPLREEARMPLSGVPALPGLPGGAVALTEAYWELTQGTLREVELEPLGVVPLFAVITPQYEVMTVARPVQGIDDMKGLKIRSAGGVQEETVEALGAVPVSIAAPETYMALQRGTADGALFSYYSVPIYKLDEVVGYATTNATLGAYPVLYSISKSVWDSLEPDLQQVLLETAREASLKEAQASQDDSAAAVADYADKIVPHEMVGAGYEGWLKATDGIREAWIERLTGEGHPAAELDAEWKKLVAGH